MGWVLCKAIVTAKEPVKLGFSSGGCVGQAFISFHMPDGRTEALASRWLSAGDRPQLLATWSPNIAACFFRATKDKSVESQSASKTGVEHKETVMGLYGGPGHFCHILLVRITF